MTATANTRGRRRVWLGFVLRLLVSVVLLMWLLRNLRGGWERLADVDPWSLWPAALVFALSSVLGAVQWAVILRHSGVELPMARLIRLYWIGLFFNNFLPSNVGGDLVKVADVALSTGGMARPLAGTMLDRVLGLLALAALALVAGAILGGESPAGLPWWLLVVVGMALAALGGGLLSRRLGRLITAVVGRVRLARMGERLGRILQEFTVYRLAPGFLARVLLLAFAVQLLRVLTHVMVARAMGMPLDAERVLGLYVLIPVLGVAIVLPISFNGLGLRELIATRLLPGIGIGAEEAFAFQFSTYFVQLAVSVIGGLLFVRRLLRPSGAPPGGASGPEEST